ncbi:hypothetical protein [Seohaeicola zhoushanensis]|uniref:Uncharacterized protein n=1 Tax=Seohaeicola zhoushanensis TaxID=1569283 RepID=A0A8J3M852_9RHOB|nr:hypothetical protein [Seohaeicola zhoushanensis]GHF50488.1 hypothetical protein GCM10017056_22730 [Seohaeicola zhoushanensis]
MRYAAIDWETAIPKSADPAGVLHEVPGLLSDGQIDILALTATLAIFAAYALLRRGDTEEQLPEPPRLQLAPPRPVTTPLALVRRRTRLRTRPLTQLRTKAD